MREVQKYLIVLLAYKCRIAQRQYMDCPDHTALICMNIAQDELDKALAGDFEVGAGITLSDVQEGK